MTAWYLLGGRATSRNAKGLIISSDYYDSVINIFSKSRGRSLTIWVHKSSGEHDTGEFKNVIWEMVFERRV